MNLIVLPRGIEHADALARGEPREVELSPRQARHLATVLRVEVGAVVRVGLCDGPRGGGRIVALDGERARLEVALDPADRPARPWADLLLAIPRPRQLRRVVQHAAALGVDALVLLRTWRVEQGYLGSKLLDRAALDDEALLGLEQAGSTWAPRLAIERRFKPFVEDRLPALFAEPATVGVVCDPAAPRTLAEAAREPALAAALARGRVVAAIGPERGFTPYEVDLLAAAGCAPVRLGDRILRVETATPVLLGQLALLRELATERSPVS